MSNTPQNSNPVALHADELIMLASRARDDAEGSIYRAVFDSLREQIAVLDQRGVILAVNDAWRQFAAKNGAPNSVADAVGQNYLDACRQVETEPKNGDSMTLSEGILAVIDGRLADYQLEYTCHGPQAKEWFLAVVTPLVSSKPGAVVSHRNITKKKQMQLVAQQRERDFLVIASRMPGPVARVDRDLRYSFVNEHGTKMFGLHPSEIVGTKISDRLSPPKFLQVEPFARRALLGESVTFEICLNSSTGHPYELLVSFLPDIDMGGNVVGFIVVGLDVTAKKQAEAERKSLETQLRESQKMEAIGTLAGGIAHDFNNILAVILANTQLAQQRLVQGDKEPFVELTEIKNASDRAQELVQQILSYSRRQPSERKAISLAAVVEETLKFVRAIAPARIQFHAEYAQGVPSIHADETQMEQVIMNLLTNAMQAVPSGPGNVWLKLESIEINSASIERCPILLSMFQQRVGTVVKLSVTDDGIGMSKETLERVFEPFFTTKSTNQGTGLGLSVAHGIIQNHDGRIVAESEVDKGSCFSIYLPGMPMQHPMDVPPIDLIQENDLASSSTTCRSDRAHILYLDDEEPILRVSKLLLEAKGFQITTFARQAEALEAIRSNPEQFSLVITDHNMPGMSGLEVAREIRKIRSDLQVALTSGYFGPELRADAEAAKIRFLIPKPLPVDELYQAICQILSS